jgi:hypothetical protein
MTEARLGAESMAISISDEVEGGRYSRIALKSDLGEACKNVYGVHLRAFLDALEKAYETLEGKAEFEALEGDFSLVIAATGLGRFVLDAELASLDRGAVFKTSGGIDQSHLPPFLDQARRLDLKNWSD